MKENIKIMSLSYILLLFLLILSGSLSGVLSEMVYVLAFMFPAVVSILLSPQKNEPITKSLCLDGDGIALFLPTVFPAVSAVAVCSLITTFVMGLFGRTNSVDVGTDLGVAIVVHAIVPCILEEVCFRYVPMRSLARYSRRGAVLISAIFFSLIHHNLFSIPYAFVAGVIFMAIDLACDSILPSLVIHFVNNLLSVLLIFYADNLAVCLAIYILIAILTVISLIFIVLWRERYMRGFLYAFEKGEKPSFGISFASFVILSLLLSVSSLL